MKLQIHRFQNISLYVSLIGNKHSNDISKVNKNFKN